MGLIDIRRIEDYWNTSWESHIPFFGTMMSRNRFQSILSHLHVSDTPAGATAKKIDKIKMFLDKLVPKFSAAYNPSENLSIDETMIGFRGRFGAVQYMLLKPTKYGIKVYSIADSSNGYVLGCLVYTGSEMHTSSAPYNHLPKTAQITMRLINPYLDNGYHLYTDRFYSSMVVASELEKRKTRFTGTLNSNRKDIPDVVRSTRTKKFALPSGGYRAFRQDRFLVSAWRPEKKKNVLMLTTGYTAKFTSVTRRSGESIDKPEVVHAYNHSMNGVDRNDQLSVYYCFNRRSVKWWKKVFFWSVEITLVNSYILFKSTSPTDIKHLTYRKSVLNSLATTYLQSVTTVSRGRPRLISATPPERLDNRRHFLGKRPAPEQHECKVCSTGQKRRRTIFYCNTCSTNPPLCPVDCFEKYHTKTQI